MALPIYQAYRLVQGRLKMFPVVKRVVQLGSLVSKKRHLCQMGKRMDLGDPYPMSRIHKNMFELAKTLREEDAIAAAELDNIRKTFRKGPEEFKAQLDKTYNIAFKLLTGTTLFLTSAAGYGLVLKSRDAK
ncbi:hypothetical protein L1987_07636 [Smallanthus sonchifolius]|uniref:Uncharacterized protein n=1 Tax=Smallanthus sonchifolius TaxID=185202 RepID=A0ACB9K0Z4_9ASTR|nr:hypothetical protein L1987_07636 [Smallanthus sonchifolius]